MSSAQAHTNITAVDGPPVSIDSGRSLPLHDYALERIIYRAPHQALAPIPWPEGLAPSGTPYDRPADQPLPRADVVVVTWTVAEGQALADVLTPGMPSTSWKPYAHQWNAYKPQLTSRSPARQAGCLGYVATTQSRQRQRPVAQIRTTPGHRRDFSSDCGPVAADSRRGATQPGHHHRNRRGHRRCDSTRRRLRRHQRKVQLHQGLQVQAVGPATLHRGRDPRRQPCGYFRRPDGVELRASVSGGHPATGAEVRRRGGRRGNRRLLRLRQHHRLVRHRAQLSRRADGGDGRRHPAARPRRPAQPAIVVLDSQRQRPSSVFRYRRPRGPTALGQSDLQALRLLDVRSGRLSAPGR